MRLAMDVPDKGLDGWTVQERFVSCDWTQVVCPAVCLELERDAEVSDFFGTISPLRKGAKVSSVSRHVVTCHLSPVTDGSKMQSGRAWRWTSLALEKSQFAGTAGTTDTPLCSSPLPLHDAHNPAS